MYDQLVDMSLSMTKFVHKIFVMDKKILDVSFFKKQSASVLIGYVHCTCII